MEESFDIVHNLTQRDRLFAFFLRGNVSKPELRALYVHIIDFDSDADGDDLDFNVRFLLKLPSSSQKISGPRLTLERSIALARSHLSGPSLDAYNSELKKYRK